MLCFKGYYFLPSYLGPYKVFMQILEDCFPSALNGFSLCTYMCKIVKEEFF